MMRVKHFVQKKVHPLKYFFDVRLTLLFLFVFLTFSSILIGGYIGDRQNQVLPPQSQALDCSGHGTNDDPQCVHENNPCGFSCTSVPKVVPSCCDDIQRTGDPFQCCFAARRVCRPSQCASIQVAKQRCGQMWELGYCTEDVPTVAPTVLPIPTVQPTIRPTVPPVTPPAQPTATLVQPTVPPGYPTNTPYIRPSEPLYTVTPPLYSSPTRPYSPYPSPTYYFPPTGSPNGSPNPSTGSNPTTIISTNPQPTTDDLSASPSDRQPTGVIAKPIINFPNPEPVIRKAIGDTKDFIQRVKKSLEDFFRVVLP